MRKIQIAVCILILMIFACVFEYNHFSDAISAKDTLLQRRIGLEKVQAEISKFNLSNLKNNLCLIKSSPENEIKTKIRKISHHMTNLVLETRTSETECFLITDVLVKFLARKEQHIYDFIADLQKIENTSAKIEDIQISKKDLFEVEIKCKFYSLKQHEYNQYISFNVKPKNEDRCKIKLFACLKLAPQYTLHCILENQAFVNNLWMNIGDGNDDFSIQEINFSDMIIDEDGKSKKVKVGESW